MAEHRKITLLNTETMEETQVKVEVKSLKAEHLTNTEAINHDAAAVEAAADRARAEYEAEHGGSYLVSMIERN